MGIPGRTIANPAGLRRSANFRAHLLVVANIVPVAIALLALTVFVIHAVQIAMYPWDWDPGEWGALDGAHRLWQAPSTLFPTNSVVPIPQTYGPLLPILLLPIALLTQNPYFYARLLMLAWTALAAIAAYRLVRRQASRTIALLSVALVVAPFNQSFWYLLVRVDGPMIALWLWSAVFALPPRLQRGAGVLSWRQAWLAGALLACAAITKAPAVLFAGAIIAGWMFVNPRSALRLAAAMALVTGSLVLILQVLTGGGFLSIIALQRLHPYHALQITWLIRESLGFNWESIALWSMALALSLARRDGSWRDGAWLLWAAGPLVVPLLGKEGAVFNYLLPFFAGQAVLIGRLLGGREGTQSQVGLSNARQPWSRVALPRFASAAMVGLIALSHPFPLPNETDRLTAKTFFAFVRTRGAPILAAHPECAYREVGQPIEVEHTDFNPYFRAGLGGTREVVRKLASQSYRLLIGNQHDMTFTGAPYRPIGLCDLRFYYGLERFILLVPRDESQPGSLPSVPGARCRSLTDESR
jgi:hypothetical protein